MTGLGENGQTEATEVSIEGEAWGMIEQGGYNHERNGICADRGRFLGQRPRSGMVGVVRIKAGVEE